MRQRLKQAIAATAIFGWKTLGLSAPADAQSSRETAWAYELSANILVSSDRLDPGYITCGSSSGGGFVYNGSWLINGNAIIDPATFLYEDWIEVGTSYCDEYKAAAHYVFARSQGGSYFEYTFEGYEAVSTNFKLVRSNESSAQYRAYVTKQGQSPIYAGPQFPHNSEETTYADNMGSVGLEVSNRPNSSIGYVSHASLTYLSGFHSSAAPWAGQDLCRALGDPANGYWYHSSHWKARRLNSATHSGC